MITLDLPLYEVSHREGSHHEHCSFQPHELSQWEVSLLYNSWVSFRQLRHHPLVPCSWCYPVASCMIFPHCKSNGFFRYKIVIVYYKLHLVIMIISWIGFWPSIFSSDSSHFLSDSACVQWPADGHCWYICVSPQMQHFVIMFHVSLLSMTVSYTSPYTAIFIICTGLVVWAVILTKIFCVLNSPVFSFQWQLSLSLLIYRYTTFGFITTPWCSMMSLLNISWHNLKSLPSLMCTFVVCTPTAFKTAVKYVSSNENIFFFEFQIQIQTKTKIEPNTNTAHQIQMHI